MDLVDIIIELLSKNEREHQLDIADVVDHHFTFFKTMGNNEYRNPEQLLAAINERRIIALDHSDDISSVRGKRFFERYIEYLRADRSRKGKEWPKTHVDKLESEVKLVFGKMIHEDLFVDTDKTSDNRGLVLGRVQSGKTSNFIGLMNMALDYGFDAIIVLTSNNEALRYQTQKRVEEGVYGYRTDQGIADETSKVGVGFFSKEKEYYFLDLLTSRSDDISSDAVNKAHTWDKPQIFVSKKDKNILQNILYMLFRNGNSKLEGSLNYRLLLIDDEGDYSSIDKSRPNDDDERAINARIRAILSIFRKRVLCSYTASPYANLLSYLNPDPRREIDFRKENNDLKYILGFDLFPKDFFLMLEKNDNYYGVDELFGKRFKNELIVNLTNLADQGDNWEEFFGGKWVDKYGAIISPNPLEDGNIPTSLQEAVNLFIIAAAMKKYRKTEQFDRLSGHSSMMIHNSNNVEPHNVVRQNVEDYINKIKKIKNKDQESFFQTMRNVYIKYYSSVKGNEIRVWVNDIGYNDPILMSDQVYEDWSDISPLIGEILETIEVLSLNTSDEGVKDLSFEDDNFGTRVIVGGSKLSRGLTVDGLIISYFTRLSGYMDSLLQMGRWFGYREGYIDLCRIFTTQEIIDGFRIISEAHQYLRSQIHEANEMQRSPDQFRFELLYNRKLIDITSGPFKNRLVRLSNDWQDKTVEPKSFKIDIDRLETDFTYFKNVIESSNVREVRSQDNQIDAYEVLNVNTDWILQFINNIKTRGIRSEKLKSILNYISPDANSQENDLLVDGDIRAWNVYIKTLRSNNHKHITVSTKINDSRSEIKIILPTRTNTNDKGEFDYEISGGRLLDPKDELLDFSGMESEKLTGSEARKRRFDDNRALFVIYLIDLKNSNNESNHPELGRILKQKEDLVILTTYAFIFPLREGYGGGDSIFPENNLQSL